MVKRNIKFEKAVATGQRKRNITVTGTQIPSSLSYCPTLSKTQRHYAGELSYGQKGQV